jgi:hypothetical protein
MSDQLLQAAQRRPFEGVAKILRYNWPQYLVGTVVVAAAGLSAIMVPLPPWATTVLLIGAALAGWWLLASVVVSHWVYDRSRLYEWTWVREIGLRTPIRWINVHAGLDESTPGLAAVLGQPPVLVLDIFDPAEMTEPSIARARKDAAKSWPSVPWTGTVPDEVQNVDVMFAIFCLHEVRRDHRRAELMSDLSSRLSAGGRCFVVEHLRDTANFLAFGGGFVHFLSQRVWLATFSAASLRVVSERRITPFVRVFELQRASE